jgi:hypothetical protein
MGLGGGAGVVAVVVILIARYVCHQPKVRPCPAAFRPNSRHVSGRWSSSEMCRRGLRRA